MVDVLGSIEYENRKESLCRDSEGKFYIKIEYNMSGAVSMYRLSGPEAAYFKRVILDNNNNDYYDEKKIFQTVGDEK